MKSTIPNIYRRSDSPDICAFILLDALAPSGEDIISASEHDIIFLSTKIEDLKKNATEEDIIALMQCGIQYDSTYDCLTMFK